MVILHNAICKLIKIAGKVKRNVLLREIVLTAPCSSRTAQGTRCIERAPRFFLGLFRFQGRMWSHLCDLQLLLFQEKACEQDQPPHVAFCEADKDFGGIDRGIVAIPQETELPGQIFFAVTLVPSRYSVVAASSAFPLPLLDTFPISTGSNQESHPLLYLLDLFVAFVIAEVFHCCVITDNT